MAKIKGTEFESLTLITSLYDKYYDAVAARCSKSTTSAALRQVMKGLSVKNRDALMTQIVGKQVIINASTEDEIFGIFGLDRADIKAAMRDSEYFKHIGNGKELALADQLALALPLIFASLAYKRLKKQEESDLCYLLLFFKPYASRVSLLFKYGVKEDQMLYTVERDLASVKYDISHYGTVMNVLDNKARVSYANYIEPKGAKDKITDAEFSVIYQSGVASRVNQFIGQIYEKYMANAGKSLSYDSGTEGVFNKDAGEVDDYAMADIDSDDSVKAKIAYKVSTYAVKNPVETRLVEEAGRLFADGRSNTLNIILTNIIEETKDKLFEKLPMFISDMVSSFLFTTNERTGQKYTTQDLKSAVFLKVGMDNLIGKKSNLSKDSALYRARQTFEEMIGLTKMYIGSMTYQRNIRKMLAFYWVALIKIRG